jgi:hypothetical protein
MKLAAQQEEEPEAFNSANPIRIYCLRGWLDRCPGAEDESVLAEFFNHGHWPQGSQDAWRVVGINVTLPGQRHFMGFIQSKDAPQIDLDEVLILHRAHIRTQPQYRMQISLAPKWGVYLCGFNESNPAVKAPIKDYVVSQMARRY